MPIYYHVKQCSRLLILLCFISTVILYFFVHGKIKKNRFRSENDLTVRYSSALPVVQSHKVETVPSDIKDTNSLHISHEVFRFGRSHDAIILAVVLCGERLNQTVVTLKSVAMLSKAFLHFVVMADDNNQDKIKEKLLKWPKEVLKRLSFEIHPIVFPSGKDGDEWKMLFKLCASQRLFLPSLLHHIDSLIYVDTDVLFMHPVEKLWQYFYQMNKSQIAGLAPEHEDFATGWYNRFARHPYYEPLGVNSGVMLMNLTRMRAFKWETYLQPVMKEYKLKIVWGDQDIINVIFHFHSECLFIFPCEWNYRPDHCMYSSVCRTAEEDGVKVIHGNRGVYYNSKQPVFKAIYQAIEKYELGANMTTDLLLPMKKSLIEAADTNCGKMSSVLTKSLENYIFNTEKVNS